MYKEWLQPYMSNDVRSKRYNLFETSQKLFTTNHPPASTGFAHEAHYRSILYWLVLYIPAFSVAALQSPKKIFFISNESGNEVTGRAT